MSNQFQFELVSPEKLVMAKQVELVTVPGGEGDYGVLAGHAPMITTVRPGVIETFPQTNSTAADRIFVAGGFAEVTAERCTVLAEEAIPVAELNRVELEDAFKTLTVEADKAQSDAERATTATRLAVVQAKLLAMGGGAAQGH